MKRKTAGENNDLSEVSTKVYNDTFGKQIKNKSGKNIKNIQEFQLNNLGGPLEEDFKIQD